MISTVIHSLEKQIKHIKWMHCDDGSRLLFLPYGGRLLGLFSDDSDTNFFWTNKKLNSHESASEVFIPNSWHNTGGERTWIAPELDIFFPDYPLCQTHWEPPQLDASDYSMDVTSSGVTLSNHMRIYLARPDKNVDVLLKKEFSPAPNPLRFDLEIASLNFSEISYAGYTQKTVLQYEGEGDAPSLGIWNINQLPHGGVMIIPTWYKSNPSVIFGEIPTEYLYTNSRSIHFHARLEGEQKIGIRAIASMGRIGYVFQQDGEVSLVIRNFYNNPSGDYVDVPKSSPEDYGYSIFGVNVNSDMGDFCEVEYHAPAIRTQLGETMTKDVSQIWAFRGRKPQMTSIAQILLGEDINHLI